MHFLWQRLLLINIWPLKFLFSVVIIQQHSAKKTHHHSLNLGFLGQSLLRLKDNHLLKVKCCFAGSYQQQAVYPQQSSAPVYPPAMQMSPQAPPYTDTPPAYSEVTITFICHMITQYSQWTVLTFHFCCLQIYQPRYVLPHQVPGQVAQMSSHYPGAQMFMPMQHMPVGQMGQNVPMAYYPMGAMYPHGSTVMVDSSYDAGARFTAGSGVSIPVSIHLVR